MIIAIYDMILLYQVSGLVDIYIVATRDMSILRAWIEGQINIIF